MTDYNRNECILGMSESRWSGAGRLKTATGEAVLFSGREDHQCHEGVGIIVKKGIERALIGMDIYQ